MADIEGLGVSAAFVRELRGALNHLYDWAELRNSLLLPLFGLEHKEDPPTALRRLLASAIDALKPAPQVSLKARAWRTHKLLYARYTEQLTQMETAADLGLSIRHLRREESLAVETLAAYLWDQYDLAARWQGTPSRAEDGAAPKETPSQAEELDWLERALPNEPVDVDMLLEKVLNLLRPLAQSSDVRVEYRPPDRALRSVLQAAPVRQALLTVSTMAVRFARGGCVRLEALSNGAAIRIEIDALGRSGPPPLADEDRERLQVARRLIELSQGSLEIRPRTGDVGTFRAVVALPATEQVPVLVIDDNKDTLQLLGRYLSNSPYHFTGTADPEQAVHLASELGPRVIVLDVMLPGIDGWELLGRLREHPRLRGVPIVVCSIVPQEQLAQALGAAGFIPKPVDRNGFLAALDQQCASWAKAPH